MKTLPKRVWLGFDWKQAELYFLALFSQDDILKKALLTGDAHKAVASDLFEIPIDEVTPDQRKLSKLVQYGLVYSGFDIPATTASILRDESSLDKDQVMKALSRYQKVYNKLFDWVEDAVFKWYDKDGEVEYFLGETRMIPITPNLPRKADMLRADKNARVAINTYGQNSVGLLLKLVLAGIKNTSILRESTSQYIQVFDSLNFLVETKYIKEVFGALSTLVTPELEHDGFKIRMAVDWKLSSESWGDMRELNTSRLGIEATNHLKIRWGREGIKYLLNGEKE